MKLEEKTPYVQLSKSFFYSSKLIELYKSN